MGRKERAILVEDEKGEIILYAVDCELHLNCAILTPQGRLDLVHRNLLCPLGLGGNLIYTPKDCPSGPS